MKKKLMMVAVLLGALSLGACVENNESASVEAVRGAKAKQLESVAALNNAKAEAELIRANAEKAMAEAKAAYDKACADGKAEETAYAKQKYALELLRIKADCDAAIAKAKSDMAFYEQAIWENADSYVKKVFTAYSLAVSEVNELNSDLIDAKLNLAQIDIDAITAEAYLKQFLAEQNTLLANAKAEKERISTLKTADKAELLKKMNELSAQAYNLLNTDQPAARKAVDAATKVYYDTYNPINPDYQNYDSHAADIMLSYTKAWKNLEAMGNRYNVSFVSVGNEEVEIEDCPYAKYISTCDLSVNSSFIKATQTVTNGCASLVKYCTDIVGAPSVKDKSAASGCYMELERAQAALTDAKTKLAAEEKKETKDEALIASLKHTIELETVNVAMAEEKLVAAKEDLEDAKAEQKEFLADLDMVKKGSKEQLAYDATFKASIEAAKKLLTAQHAADRVQAAISVIGIESFYGTEVRIYNWTAEYGKVKSLYDGTLDIVSILAQCDIEIAEIEAKIKSGGSSSYVQTEGYYYVFNPITGNTERVYGMVYALKPGVSISKEDAQKKAQAEIDAIQKKLDVKNTLVTKYKAELDALLAAQ